MFITIHWIAFHNGKTLVPTKQINVCECISKCLNISRFKRSTYEVAERDLSLTVTETRGNIQLLKLQGGSETHAEYEEIDLQPRSGTLEVQHNVAYAGVSVQHHSQAARGPKSNDRSGLHVMLELQENTAYQRTSRFQEHSGFPVYEAIN